MLEEAVEGNEGDGGGFEFHNGAIVGGDSSAQIDYRAKTVTPLGEPDYDNRSGPFKRVTPALLLRTLQDRADNAYYLGEVETDGVTFDLIGFSMPVGPAITLYFEKDTHLLRRSERVFAGFGLVEYRFDEYKNRSGIPFNKRFTLLLNGDTNLLRENLSVTMNAPVDEMLSLREGNGRSILAIASLMTSAGSSCSERRFEAVPTQTVRLDSRS